VRAMIPSNGPIPAQNINFWHQPVDAVELSGRPRWTTSALMSSKTDELIDITALATKVYGPGAVQLINQPIALVEYALVAILLIAFCDPGCAASARAPLQMRSLPNARYA
jgi:hypothetical protein